MIHYASEACGHVRYRKTVSEAYGHMRYRQTVSEAYGHVRYRQTVSEAVNNDLYMVTCKMAAPVTGTTSRTTGPVPADSRQ